MNKPKISVLIPAFNEEENLYEAVENVLKAKHTRLEILIGVDDGADKTLEVAKKLSKRYKNISVTYHPKRVGVVANMNSILRKSKGEIVLKFDADMRVGNPKNFFSNLINHFNNKNVGGIAIVGYRSANRKIKREIEVKKQSIITRGEYVVYDIVDMFKKNSLPLRKIPDFPFDIQCFRRSIISGIEPNVVHDDAFFAYKVLEKGYTIEDGSDVVVIHLGTPQTVKGLSNTRIKGQVGWSELSKKYPINFRKYYFGLLSIFLKNLKIFSIYDIFAFFCWLIVFSTSIVISKFNKNKPIATVWKKRM